MVTPYGELVDKIPCIIDPKDLITTIKRSHYSVVSQLSQSQLDEYANKVGVLEGILGLGLSFEKPVI